MPDYSLPLYDKPRDWIKEFRDQGNEWNDIETAGKASDEALQRFLENQEDLNFWPQLTVDEWKQIVGLQKASEEGSKRIDYRIGIAQIHDDREENATTVPQDPVSSWQLYKKKLLADGLKEDTVEEIERTTLKILKRLNNDTRSTGPVKGLVIGNVQSGKTANMAALMSMAADWGWNMFIILSGTIENLRIQTQTRLFSDLNQQGTLFWRSLEHLSRSVDISQKAQSLHFDPSSKERYFTVCLKNSARLKKLIQWAQADKHKQEQMKILVIDDEADQAGINTGNIDAAERKKINKLICALVNGQNEKAEEIETKYRAMNYVGYTATPYANILNEAKPESLYPRSFITTLAVSREYFGPQQIFGYSSEDKDSYFSGMDIVRTISDDELTALKNIHDGLPVPAPNSLVDAVCWFLSGVACMRIWGYRKPVSMLVHTSQKTAHHSEIADAIGNWLGKTPGNEIIKRVKDVWDAETQRFTAEDFREQYPQYDRPDTEINGYPPFEEIEEQIRIILGDGISHIRLGDDGDLTYHKGIHLCIDNCTNTGITSDGMHVRLAYPDSRNMPSPAPAFIVVGGATLSRGLTLEGLMSTFFIRSVGQADTLMQMGRWFGYRRGYELLPRVWMTEKTRAQFDFLSSLDQELRNEIQYMDINGRSPADYGPKVKNSPKVSFIRITARNRMQGATSAEMDYSGFSNQVYLFDNDEEILESNISLTEKFIEALGKEWIDDDPLGLRRDSIVWRNVPFSNIKQYIEQFTFNDRLKVFNNTEPLLKWIEKMTKEEKLGSWNVIVAGKRECTNGIWNLPGGRAVNKVLRTRKAPQNETDDAETVAVINLGALREPSDLLKDIDINAIGNNALKAEITAYIKSGETAGATAYRDKSGLSTTPQMIIYRVDKDSKASRKTRRDLNSKRDLIGICLYIPGGRIGTNYTSSVSIKMDNDLFDGNPDVEGTDEN